MRPEHLHLGNALELGGALPCLHQLRLLLLRLLRLLRLP